MKSSSQNKKNMRGLYWNPAFVIFWTKIQLTIISYHPHQQYFFTNIFVSRIFKHDQCLFLQNLGDLFDFITTLPRFCRATMGSYVFLKFFVFWSPYYGDFTKQKNAFFDDFPIKKLCLATTFLWLLALRVPKISIFSHFSRLQIYFKQLIVKI